MNATMAMRRPFLQRKKESEKHMSKGDGRATRIVWGKSARARGACSSTCECEPLESRVVMLMDFLRLGMWRRIYTYVRVSVFSLGCG